MIKERITVLVKGGKEVGDNVDGHSAGWLKMSESELTCYRAKEELRMDG